MNGVDGLPPPRPVGSVPKDLAGPAVGRDGEARNMPRQVVGQEYPRGGSNSRPRVYWTLVIIKPTTLGFLMRQGTARGSEGRPEVARDGRLPSNLYIGYRWRQVPPPYRWKQVPPPTTMWRQVSRDTRQGREYATTAARTTS